MANVTVLLDEEGRERFEGTVIKRDADGFGYIEIIKPESLSHKLGVFTAEVLDDPSVSRIAKKGSFVTGKVLQSRGGGLKVLRIDAKK